MPNATTHRRRTLAQTAYLPIRSLISLIFDAHSYWPMLGFLAVVGLVGAYFSAGLVGISGAQIRAALGAPPPTPSSGAAKLPPVAYTCAEQKMMRSEWAVFGQGLRSDAPHAWAGKPSGGVFFIQSDGPRQAAYNAVDLLRQSDGGSPEGLESAGQLLKEASAGVGDNDRSIIQYHRGLVLLRQGVTTEAAKQFEGVQKAITDRKKPLDPLSTIQKSGIQIANLHAWGIAQLASNPAEGAGKLEQALYKATHDPDRRLLVGPGDARVTLYRLQPSALVDLSVAELYTDAIAGNIQALARAACDKPDYVAAVKRLEADIAPFRGDPLVTASWPELTANLQLAGALLGDASFVRQFPIMETDTAAARASNAARTVVGAPQQSDQAGQGVTTGDTEWSRLARWRGYFYAGEAPSLYSEVRAIAADDPRLPGERAWLAEMVQKAMRPGDPAQATRDPGQVGDTSLSSRREIWIAYGDLTGGAGLVRNAELRAPFGLVIGLLLVGLIFLAFLAFAAALLAVRHSYVQLYVSEHRRERLRAGAAGG